MVLPSKSVLSLLALVLLLSGCFSYSFSGGNIPPNINKIYIPFFPDKTNSGQASLSDQLNQALVNRFINQSRLQMVADENDADVVLKGDLVSYRNTPFSISGEDISTENRVEIVVKAVYKYTEETKPVYDKSFNGFFNYDTTTDPIQGEQNAIVQALDQISRKMFDEAVGQW
ncbi:hypothetical protein EP331_07045 [bacterium]|nr:MAG: hypothetical protein EP331_07045 [bacterium]